MSKEAHSEQENFLSVSLSEDQKTVTITVAEGVEVKYQKAEEEKENQSIYEVAKDGEAVVVTHMEGVTVNVEYFETEEEPAPAPKPWDKPITLGLVGALVLAVLIVVIRRATRKEEEVVIEAAPAPVVEAPTAPGSAGKLKLHNVEPKTAAMVMAIVADKLQKPINELRFISIKEVE